MSLGCTRCCTIAFADPGTTLCLLPAWNTVSAVVVRTSVDVLCLAASTRRSKGPNSHRLLTSSFMPNVKPGRSAVNMLFAGPSRVAGSGWRSSLLTALARMPTADSNSGAEE